MNWDGELDNKYQCDFHFSCHHPIKHQLGVENNIFYDQLQTLDNTQLMIFLIQYATTASMMILMANVWG